MADKARFPEGFSLSNAFDHDPGCKAPDYGACTCVEVEPREGWAIATLILTAQSALDHCEELAEAWQRGALSEHDGKGGTRSNRNTDVANRLRKSLRALGKEPASE